MKSLIYILTLSTQVFALSGLEVMQKVEESGKGFIGSESQLKMTLIDAHGESVEREMSAIVLENNKTGDY
jgi:hypothetical protein